MTQAACDLLRVSAASQTTFAYVRVCVLARQAEVQRRSVDLLDASPALNERQLAAGLSSELQRRRLLALRERTRVALPMFEARRRVAFYELTLLSGRSPRQLDVPAVTCAGISQPRRALPTGDGWSLLVRRPDVRAAGRRLAAADARCALAEAKLYPHTSSAASAETSVAALAGLGGSGTLAYAAGPLLSRRSPNQESARGRPGSAMAERDAALVRFDGVVLGVLREVERALALYAGGRQRRADLQRAFDEQRHAYRLARSNYRAGVLGALELLDSQCSLVIDRARLADAEMRVAEHQVEPFRAPGGGWQVAPSSSRQDNGQ